MIKPKGRKYERPRFPRSKWLKYFHHRKNRRATKEVLGREDYESIPPRAAMKEEDVWNWG